jgi:hypothetical protein
VTNLSQAPRLRSRCYRGQMTRVLTQLNSLSCRCAVVREAWARLRSVVVGASLRSKTPVGTCWALSCDARVRSVTVTPLNSTVIGVCSPAGTGRSGSTRTESLPFWTGSAPWRCTRRCCPDTAWSSGASAPAALKCSGESPRQFATHGFPAVLTSALGRRCGSHTTPGSHERNGVRAGLVGDATGWLYPLRVAVIALSGY